ncbi:MAG: cyclic nucleotide-binding domain-containing protein [Immundisolibacteraceae bacterium]|nr:cyclic nucleotide-binding domain-containing protein [Immundisolibacteraceae bacterium]
MASEQRTAAVLARPQRWDSPFDASHAQLDASKLLQIPEIAAIEADRFPRSLPLEGILSNDCRFVQRQSGEIIIREGDYGSSAFLVISGSARVILPPGIPIEQLGRHQTKSKSLWQSFSQLWSNNPHVEARNLSRYGRDSNSAAIETHVDELGTVVIDRGDRDGPNLKTIIATLNTVPMPKGSLFGEVAALRREPRSASIIADENCLLLEIRWQGLRDIRKHDPGWRKIIDQSYRQNTLLTHLREHPLFAKLDEPALQRIADCTLFETFGSFEWFSDFQRDSAATLANNKEPVVAGEGEYSDGLLLIAAGFGRVSVKTGNGRRTLTYLRSGDHFGFEELMLNWETGQDVAMRSSLHATGYLDVLRIPGYALTEVAEALKELSAPNYEKLAAAPFKESDDLLEWAVSERYINGTQSMLIDMDKCVRCDDCVTACSRGHDGNPRFLRHGKVHGKWMIANACMHCSDPVCLIGCPTGAIHRTAEQGIVTINDDTCIGCGVCANSCPYSNIRLVEINDNRGRAVLDPASQLPIMKATKCDLCADQIGGPACVRACPADAMRRIDFHDTDMLGDS